MTNQAKQAERLPRWAESWQRVIAKLKSMDIHSAEELEQRISAWRPLPSPEERSKIIDDLAKTEVEQGTYFRVPPEERPHKPGCLYSQAYGTKCTCTPSGQEETSAGAVAVVEPVEHPSCHVCGAIMTPEVYKCRSCGATSTCTPPKADAGPDWAEQARKWRLKQCYGVSEAPTKAAPLTCFYCGKHVPVVFQQCQPCKESAACAFREKEQDIERLRAHDIERKLENAALRKERDATQDSLDAETMRRRNAEARVQKLEEGLRLIDGALAKLQLSSTRTGQAKNIEVAVGIVQRLLASDGGRG